MIGVGPSNRYHSRGIESRKRIMLGSVSRNTSRSQDLLPSLMWFHQLQKVTWSMNTRYKDSMAVGN